jgi:hypothetical protein
MHRLNLALYKFFESLLQDIDLCQLETPQGSFKSVGVPRFIGE